MENVTFKGEVMLAGWSETHSGGAKVAFWLADPSDLDAFRGLTATKGGHSGQRFAMVLVEIGDDEAPVAAKIPKAHKEQRLSNFAYSIAGNPKFQDYLADVETTEWNAVSKKLGDGATAKEIAVETVRCLTGVDSCSEFDKGGVAAAKLNELREDFLEYMEAA